jgi:hypothetical protein
MAKTVSSLKTKEQTHIKIFNFYISKKTLLIVGIAIVVLFVIIKYNSYKKQQELEQRMLAQTAQGVVDGVQEDTVLSLEEQIQQQLRSIYGIPPEGFQWDYQGNLVPLSTLEDMTAEDIVYTYLQSVHTMNFAEAQRVASKSTIIETFDDYYSHISNALVNEKDMFNRSIFRMALDSMEIEGITNTVVQADGTYVFTVDISCLDLTNKDFWRKDENEIYQTMYVYDKTETDTTKKMQYVYDYITDAYSKQLCGFHTVAVDIVVGKANSGGWLVTDDSTLRKALLYEDGVDVASYINLQYNQWLISDMTTVTDDDSDDVGFGRAQSTYDEESATEYRKGYSQESEDAKTQKLQEDLEYYMQHGELPPKGYSAEQESEETTEETTEEATTETSVDPESYNGGATEEERNSAAQEQESRETVENSQSEAQENGYSRH